ncbi:EamA family transporter [Candidatus Woesearchaeota archaeon]|nr:EamA family transporter [Candidatus Woesearchaeota archaeon]
MMWVLYALLSAFFWAGSDIFLRKLKGKDSVLVAWSRVLFGAPFLLIILFSFRYQASA